MPLYTTINAPYVAISASYAAITAFFAAAATVDLAHIKEDILQKIYLSRYIKEDSPISRPFGTSKEDNPLIASSHSIYLCQRDGYSLLPPQSLFHPLVRVCVDLNPSGVPLD